MTICLPCTAVNVPPFVNSLISGVSVTSHADSDTIGSGVILRG